MMLLSQQSAYFWSQEMDASDPVKGGRVESGLVDSGDGEFGVIKWFISFLLLIVDISSAHFDHSKRMFLSSRTVQKSHCESDGDAFSHALRLREIHTTIYVGGELRTKKNPARATKIPF